MIRNPRIHRKIHGQRVTPIAIDAHRDSGVAVRAWQGRTLDPYVNRLAKAYGATGQGRALMNQAQPGEPASGSSSSITATLTEYGNKLVELPGAALDALHAGVSDLTSGLQSGAANIQNKPTDATKGAWERFMADLKKNALPVGIATAIVIFGVPMLIRRL